MGACASSNEITPEVIELPAVDYTSGVPKYILSYIYWPGEYVNIGKYKLKRIKNHICCKNINGNCLIYEYPQMIWYKIYEMFGNSVFNHRAVISELLQTLNNNRNIFNGFIIPSAYFPCHNMKNKIDKIMYKNALKQHKIYFIQHIEEALIAYVCHPRFVDKFEGLGFYDDGN